MQGIAALLDGCELRVPGADQDQVLRALASLSGEFTVVERAATLEETMMLATLFFALGLRVRLVFFGLVLVCS